MRIEAYTQVQQLYQTKKVAKTEAAVKGSHTDKLQISSMGRDIQVAKGAVASASDIREDLTAPIKTALQNGTYEVDGDAFAAKLYAKYQEMR